jgi:hypothetical protein
MPLCEPAGSEKRTMGSRTHKRECPGAYFLRAARLICAVPDSPVTRNGIAEIRRSLTGGHAPLILAIDRNAEANFVSLTH